MPPAILDAVIYKIKTPPHPRMRAGLITFDGVPRLKPGI
jgi:hypothetical protein